VSPRPRKVSDDDVFAAMYRVMTRVGPAELTLAQIADEAGVTAGALVQRFGSKRGLQVALARGAAESAGALIAGLAAKHRSPLAAIRDYGDCMAGLAESPEAIARNIGYLAADVADPDLRAQMLVQSRATRSGLKALLDDAVKARELKPRTDTAALARVLETVVGGALIGWAVYREGTAKRWLREHVDAVLAVHLPAR
jgi:AcrR family transcriptional regulator